MGDGVLPQMIMLASCLSSLTHSEPESSSTQETQETEG